MANVPGALITTNSATWNADAMTERKPVESWLTDMDGVLVHEELALPGSAEFLQALQDHGLRFLVLTNNSLFTAAGPAGAVAPQRHHRAGGGDLDLRIGDGAVPRRPAARAVRRT